MDFPAAPGGDAPVSLRGKKFPTGRQKGLQRGKKAENRGADKENTLYFVVDREVPFLYNIPCAV